MGSRDKLDPALWYVVNHKFKHLVYRSKDRSKAKAYATARNQGHEHEYSVMSGSQLQIQGMDAVKSPSFG